MEPRTASRGHNVPVDVLAEVRRFFELHGGGVVAVYVFGSVGRGEDRPRSDVDVGVLLQHSPQPTLEGQPLELAEVLEEALGRDVDLVVLNEAPADLVHRVLRDGQLVFEADRSARIRFEVRHRNEYFDLLPILTEYRRPRGAKTPVTDPDLVLKKLAVIETCVRELRQLARPDALVDDIKERRFVEHTLQLAIQAALDVASHIVSDDRLGEPRTNRELFTLLETAGWVSPELSRTLRAMAGFRNVLVHGYDVVDLAVVRDLVENRLGDLELFVDMVRHRLR